MPALTLRHFTMADEPEALRAHAELTADGFGFLLSYEGQPWDHYLETLADLEAGRNLPERFVPSSLLAADVNGEIVGRLSLRHELNDFLATWGGHIGYGVRPAHRRRGYATAILRQSLPLAAARGLDRVLVTCDLDNVGSARVIESCGGVFEGIAEASGDVGAKRRYWISTS